MRNNHIWAKYLLVILINGLVSCISNDSGEPDPYIAENYTMDAKILHMHELANKRSGTSFSDPVLDSTEIKNILNIIQAVYSLDSKETDSIFHFYQIHTSYPYSFQSLSLRIDPQADGMDQLAMGIIPTGNTLLDNTLNKFEFDSVYAYNYPAFPWVTIYTDLEYNLLPVKNKLENIDGIREVAFGKSSTGDLTNIELYRDDNYA